jgi:hypothetical protein
MSQYHLSKGVRVLWNIVPAVKADFCPARFAIQNISGAHKPCIAMPAPGTLESFGPTNFSKMLNASLFIRKFFLKIKQTALRISFGHVSTPDNPRVHLHYELSQ